MADLERVQQNTPFTLAQQWYDDGAPSDPGIPTVGVTRDDGTVLVPPGTATAGTGTNPRTFNLTATHTALLDRLRVTWTSPTKGTLVSYVDVVGGFLFPLASLTGLVPTLTTQQAVDTRARVEQSLESMCGCAFVPRYGRKTYLSTSGRSVNLKAYLRRVRWANVDGTPLLQSDLDALYVNPVGLVTGYALYGTPGLIDIGYEHGMDAPPEPVRFAALDYATFLVTQNTTVDSRAERLITDDGTLVFGTGGLGVPSVDRVINQYRLPAVA